MYEVGVKTFSQRMFNSASEKGDTEPKSKVREHFCINIIFFLCDNWFIRKLNVALLLKSTDGIILKCMLQN